MSKEAIGLLTMAVIVMMMKMTCKASTCDSLPKRRVLNTFDWWKCWRYQ